MVFAIFIIVFPAIERFFEVSGTVFSKFINTMPIFMVKTNHDRFEFSANDTVVAWQGKPKMPTNCFCTFLVHAKHPARRFLELF